MAGTLVDEPKTLIEELEQRKSLLSVNEAAVFLNMGIATVYRRSKKGKLPHLRFGATVKFDPRELAAWLKKAHCG